MLTKTVMLFTGVLTADILALPSGVGISPLAPIAASRFHRSSALLDMKDAPVDMVGHFVSLALR